MNLSLQRKMAGNLRRQLLQVARQRSRHYDAARHKGDHIPGEALKRRYITEILTRAEAAEHYSFEGMVRLVIRLRPQLEGIIPHYYSRYRGIRESIQGMLQYCEREYIQPKQPTLL